MNTIQTMTVFEVDTIIDIRTNSMNEAWFENFFRKSERLKQPAHMSAPNPLTFHEGDVYEVLV